jgi:DNA-binding IclR family transcriptional regulator
MCLRVADELNIFTLISQKPCSSQEIANSTGADEKLVVRIMRMVIAMGFATRSDSALYSPTLAGTHLTLPSVSAGLKFKYVLWFLVLWRERNTN